MKFREVWTNLRTLTSRNSEIYNTTNQSFSILNVRANGDFTTFCPELAVAKSPRFGDFVMGNILHDDLASLPNNPVYISVHREIERGIAQCKAACSYWQFCGGGRPLLDKFFQHGRFDVTETTTCQVHKQATVDVLLEYLETKVSAKPAAQSA